MFSHCVFYSNDFCILVLWIEEKKKLIRYYIIHDILFGYFVFEWQAELEDITEEEKQESSPAHLAPAPQPIKSRTPSPGPQPKVDQIQRPSPVPQPKVDQTQRPSPAPKASPVPALSPSPSDVKSSPSPAKRPAPTGPSPVPTGPSPPIKVSWLPFILGFSFIN